MPRATDINPKTGKRYNWVDPRQAEKEARAQDNELEILERQLKAKQAQDDLLTFTEFTSPDAEAVNDVHRSKYKPAPYHRIVAKHLEEVERGDIKQLIFCMPPRHGKSELATRRLAAWYSGRHPEQNVAVAAYSDGMASDFGGDVRAIMSTPQFKQVFPKHRLRKGGTAKDNLETVQGGRLVFVGRGGPLTGRGAHCLIGESVIETSNGSKYIKDVLPGDKVLSFDAKSRAVVWRRVQAVAKREGARIFRVADNAGRVVESTSDHRFFAGDEWRKAASLAEGNRLLCALREIGTSTIGRGGEALSTRARPVLLLQHLLGASRELGALWRAGLSSVRQPCTSEEWRVRRQEEPKDILLESVLGSRASRGSGDARFGALAALRALQRVVCPAQQRKQVLQSGLRQSRSFRGDAWQEEPSLAGRSVGSTVSAAHSASLSRIEAVGASSGWRALRAVLGLGSFRGSSYRREPVEQSGLQSGDLVQAVPRDGSFYRAEGSFVASVTDTGRFADVYDIQVEETECFFANGVLVHNCLLIDDLYKDHEEARSQAIRDQAWNWFTKVAMTRRMGKKLVIITMTRWHSDDVIGRLTDPENPHYNAVEAKKWKIIRLPAIAEDDDPLGRPEGAPLWPDGPDQFDLEFLQSQQRLDPLGFAALYQQRPTVADGVLFRRENIQRYKPDELPENLRYYATSDHAVGTKQRNDPSCFGIGGIDAQDNLWMTDLFWQRVPTDRAVEQMLLMNALRRPLLWWAEKGHISQSIGPFLRKRMMEEQNYINIREVTPKDDKETRAQSIAGRVAMGKVYIPYGPIWDKAVEEMLAFPNGVHDDFVDMLSLFGLGLASQIAASRPAKAKAEAKFGTLAWVKEQDRWAEEKRRAQAHGGF